MHRSLKMIFFLTVVFLLIPAAGVAKIGRWVPTIVDYEADVDVYGIYRVYETKTDGQSLTQKWLWMRENLNLTFNGFVYHPRLVEYKIGLSLGLVQDRYETEGQSYSLTRSRSGWANAINFRAKVLPMHPYNLELFWLRYEPLSGGGFSDDSAVSYSKGAIFKYERKPYFLTAIYTNNTRESHTATSDWTSYQLNFTYFKQFKEYRTLQLTANARRVEFSSTSSPGESVGNSASLTNTIMLRRLSLASSLRYFTGDYSNASSSSFSWTESLVCELPLNFRAALNYSYTKSDSENVFAGSETSSKSNAANFSISHRLYQSLMSGYSVGFIKTDSSGGSAQSLSNVFNVSYVKNIPGGQLHSAVGFSRRNSKRDGVTATLDTQFRQAVPRNINEPPFILNFENVDEASITVFLLDPDVAEHRVRLEEGIHYIVTPFGIGYEIEIIAVPPEYPSFATYNFLVSFESTADAEVQTDTFNYRLSLDLFDKIYPYYSHYVEKQRVISGFSQGGDFDTVTDSAGIQVVLDPFRFSAAYAHVESDIVPLTTWVLDAYYQKYLTPTTLLNARVQYTHTDYPEGTSGNGIAYTEQRAGGMVGITKGFPTKGVSLHASGSYWRSDSLTDSDSYSLSSSVSWKVLRFILEFGASFNFVESESAVLKTERNYQNYYFRLRRKIF